MSVAPLAPAKSALPMRAEATGTAAASDDKRTAPRLAPAMVPSITGIRLLPDDVEASLVNISTSGMLIECAARPRPGTAVTVRFSGTFPTPMAQGRVVRAMVGCLGQDGLLRYHLGIAFDAPISLEATATPTDAEASPAAVPGETHQLREQHRPALQNRW